MSASAAVAVLRVFDLQGDGDGMERHYVAEAVGGTDFPPGVYQLHSELALDEAYAEGRTDQLDEDMDLLRWAYSKLHFVSFAKQEDALMQDRFKLLLEHGIRA